MTFSPRQLKGIERTKKILAEKYEDFEVYNFGHEKETTTFSMKCKKCGYCEEKIFYNRFSTRKTKCLGCPRASKPLLHKKITQEFVEKEFKDKGLILKDKYTIGHILMNCECDKCGRILKTNRTRVRRLKHRACQDCALKTIEWEDVVKTFEDKNCNLITTKDKYVNKSVVNLKFFCHCDNIGIVSFKNFEKGTRCTKCVDNKRIRTWIKNFGYDHPMRCPEIFMKHQRSSYKTKLYTFPSGGRTALVQGYEGYALDYIFKEYGDNVLEDDILVDDENIPIVMYEFEGSYRPYFPDFYIPKYKFIIEIKSTFTCIVDKEKNFKKWKATVRDGYNIGIYIFDKKKLIQAFFREANEKCEDFELNFTR
ncbi:hypothetical protein OAG24_00355 [bacterium]|nr:hypothetical protein [bacterium]